MYLSLIFGVVMSLSMYIDNKGKDILVFGKITTQRLNDTTLTVETQYSLY